MKMLFRAAMVLLTFAAAAPAAAQVVTLPQVHNAGGVNVPSQGSVAIGSDGVEKGTPGNPVSVSVVGGADASAANQASQISQETAINTVLGTATASPTANTIADRLKTINTTLGSPFQVGGSIGNTTFGATQSGTWNINNIGGTISLPTGAATSANQSTLNATIGTVGSTAPTTGPMIVAIPLTGSPLTSLTSGVANNLILDTRGKLLVTRGGGSTGTPASTGTTVNLSYAATTMSSSSAAPDAVLSYGWNGTNTIPLKADSDGSMTTVGNRLSFISGSVGTTQTTAYSLGNNVGGLVTVATGLTAGTQISACRLIFASNQVTAVGSMYITMFDANPSASTFTDGSAQVIANADVTKVIASAQMTVNTGASTGLSVWIFAACPRLTVGASGNIWMALTAPAGLQFATTTPLSYRIDMTR